MSVLSRHDAPHVSAATAEQGIHFVHLARARRLLEEGQYDVARQELELALLARPGDEDVLNLLSVAEFKRLFDELNVKNQRWTSIPWTTSGTEARKAAAREREPIWC